MNERLARFIESLRHGHNGAEEESIDIDSIPTREYLFGKIGEDYYFSIVEDGRAIHTQRSSNNAGDFYKKQGEIEGFLINGGIVRKELKNHTASNGQRLNPDSHDLERWQCEEVEEELIDVFFDSLEATIRKNNPPLE